MSTQKFAIVAVAYLSFALLVTGQEKRAITDIRQIDFRNFRYPWRTATTPEDFHWLTGFDTALSLRDGVHVFKGGGCGGPFRRCPEVWITDVLYTNVNDDSIQDAIIVLRYFSGGTAY